MAADEMIVGELASFGAGQLRLRDSDILVVKTNRDVPLDVLASIRTLYENELSRLGFTDPNVLAIPAEISFEVIERA